MIDKAIYTDMGGAKAALQALRVITNNLANANTTGFQADYETTGMHVINQQGMQTRITPTQKTGYSDFKQGPMLNTDRSLDIAIQGAGFIAVQTKDGNEAYTRVGSLELTSDGVMVTSRGDFVLGTAGLIKLPPASRINIDSHGAISVQLIGQEAKNLANVDRLKLVDIPGQQLVKGFDGLFYPREETTALASDTVTLKTGMLEGSNVDPVRSLTELIDLSRQFELHTKMMSTIDDNAIKANELLNVSR